MYAANIVPDIISFVCCTWKTNIPVIKMMYIPGAASSTPCNSMKYYILYIEHLFET